MEEALAFVIDKPSASFFISTTKYSSMFKIFERQRTFSKKNAPVCFLNRTKWIKSLQPESKYFIIELGCNQ